ncbi:hypothetical protein [Campylobacter gastrosuis]|uniref:Uncharacterized protein n=1 Tax=Campylobacter gastrosuis TaxID=2974576 RepID=A0ABT7HRR5_9BACT|nr:hypothetical protein [Campylobacter gastrosuis]MDL0089108.1 hypothetical protein [Campylobacter gastrosuis]
MRSDQDILKRYKLAFCEIAKNGNANCSSTSRSERAKHIARRCVATKTFKTLQISVF